MAEARHACMGGRLLTSAAAWRWSDILLFLPFHGSPMDFTRRTKEMSRWCVCGGWSAPWMEEGYTVILLRYDRCCQRRNRTRRDDDARGPGEATAWNDVHRTRQRRGFLPSLTNPQTLSKQLCKLHIYKIKYIYIRSTLWLDAYNIYIHYYIRWKSIYS